MGSIGDFCGIVLIYKDRGDYSVNEYLSINFKMFDSDDRNAVYLGRQPNQFARLVWGTRFLYARLPCEGAMYMLTTL